MVQQEVCNVVRAAARLLQQGRSERLAGNVHKAQRCEWDGENLLQRLAATEAGVDAGVNTDELLSAWDSSLEADPMQCDEWKRFDAPALPPAQKGVTDFACGFEKALADVTGFKTCGFVVFEVSPLCLVGEAVGVFAFLDDAKMFAAQAGRAKIFEYVKPFCGRGGRRREV